jgi:hypothetical protein
VELETERDNETLERGYMFKQRKQAVGNWIIMFNVVKPGYERLGTVLKTPVYRSL